MSCLKKCLRKVKFYSPSREAGQKCSCKINFGLAPYFQELIHIALSEAPFNVVSFGENHNNSSKKQQMDLNIPSWDNIANIVQTRYLTTFLTGKPTAVDVFESFQKCSNTMDNNKMIQISSDGPNVNLHFLDLIRRNRKDNNQRYKTELLKIGTCGLHTVHGSLKLCIKVTQWSLDKILPAKWKSFNQSLST